MQIIREFNWMGFHLGKTNFFEYMKKTMRASYDLFEEVYMHATPETLSINLNEPHESNDGENISKETDLDKICKIVPTVVQVQTLNKEYATENIIF